MNNQPTEDEKAADEKMMGKLVLDIGGLDNEPVDRGLTVKKRGDFFVLNIGKNGSFASIELTETELQNLRYALTNGQTLEERATEAFDTLFSTINKMGTGEATVIKVMNDAMGHQHRTLIQQWWGVIAKVIKEYAKTKEGWFDLRNQDSIEWAREVAKVESHMRFI